MFYDRKGDHDDDYDDQFLGSNYDYLRNERSVTGPPFTNMV